MVFYRKYRPQKIQELDSEAVRTTLSSILSRRDSVPHAFLFIGPKGLGKTSAARIVAKIVNCEKLNAKRSTLNSGIEPCNKCGQCLSITNGTNLDVLEIDAASNRGIDEIRELREKIKLAPALARVKVYIIDEAHMLTREAFNALLKTLEEPPAHIMFILCTTEPEKLPETITSRCFAIRFKKAREEEIIRALSRIIKIEKIEIDKEAILKIIKLSEGSFRDAVKIFEQLKAQAGRKKITASMVEQEYNQGLAGLDFLELILKKKTKDALLSLEKMVKEGVNIKLLTNEILYALHELLLEKMGVKEKKAEDFEELEVADLSRLMLSFEKAAQELKMAVIPQLPLEVAIIEWGAEGDAGVMTGLNPVNVVSNNSNFWQELIEKVKAHNHSVAGVLRGCTLKSFDGEKLIIEAGYKFHKERLEEKKTKTILEKISSEIAGKPISINIAMKGGLK